MFINQNAVATLLQILRGICALVFHFAGRLKSPPIDRFTWSKSITGDFNRPSNVKTNEQMPFLSICGIAVVRIKVCSQIELP